MVDIRYYTTQEVADLIKVDVEMVLAWIASGELKAHDLCKKQGGKRPTWRIAEAELGRLLLRRQYGTVPTSEPVDKLDKSSRQPKPAQEFV